MDDPRDRAYRRRNWYRGLAVAISQRAEEKGIRVTLRAQANVRDYTNEGFGLRVSILNEGLRALSVDRLRLFIDGKPLATASGYLADPRHLDRYMMSRLRSPISG